jgi:peptidoglycan/LPS O-acetylase OafA/YrhL
VAVALTWTADLPFFHGSMAIFHLWTLAMEEQFYLLWPLVLVLAVRTRRAGLVIGLAGLACLLACVLTIIYYRRELDLAYPLPTSWAGCFVIGGAARWWSGRLPALRRTWPLLLPLAVLSLVPLRGHAATYLLAAPLIAGLTALLARSWHDRPVEIPFAGALAALGTVSYGAYLWNYPLTVWLRPVGWYGAPLALGATLLLAAATWRWVEQPLLRLRERRVAAGTVGLVVT